ncbi:hypothetical protein N7489_002004 [Penicillium chrysogenum]|uniref:MULE transposase domain-containing protein n=1 Tax=Penicillium chrysogenum TaxID=5076 RepID=A0ABQ8WLI2_PENCH|nr:uncharacterized protein N7489_002004 [Penicillium chrysogenum]KAJ5251594.1 hypothetical protein N7489_002004 [Penicillium chrysogenum]KAJ5270495.1 hypothetical protein N7505_006253 [Penicillium chrysogenum]
MDCTYKTNRYGLPLLDIVGFAATGSTYYLGFAFIKDEKDDSYEVVLNCLAEVYESLGLDPPRTILTDKEQALMNAIETIFPSTKNMICIWHINIYILKKARPILRDQIAKSRIESTTPSSTTPSSTTPSSTQHQTKKDRERELTQKVDEGWKKMLKRWNRIVYTTSPEVMNQ